MKHPIFKSLMVFTFIAIVSSPTWAIRPIEDLRAPKLVENSVVEKITSDITAASNKTAQEAREEEVERIRKVLRLDELDRQNTMAEALRQENLEERVRGHEDLELAMEEKNVDLHMGKVLTDMHGNRVRMEEYVLRPAANQVQFLNLTMRADRLDYANYNAYFNDILPRCPRGLFAKRFGKEAPEIYLVRETIEYSNLTDSVVYGVEYFEPTWDHFIQQYVLSEQAGSLAVNNIQKAGFSRTTVEEDIIWDGIESAEFEYINRNLLATRIKYHFDDGTYLQVEDYLIGEDGSLRQLRWDHYLEDLANILENFTAMIFNTYKEKILTATEFEDRTIDTVSQFMHLVDVFKGEAERPWR